MRERQWASPPGETHATSRSLWVAALGVVLVAALAVAGYRLVTRTDSSPEPRVGNSGAEQPLGSVAGGARMDPDDIVEVIPMDGIPAIDEPVFQRVLTLDPGATVRILPGLTPKGEHPELCEVDLIVGCVDDDGPRHRLNEIAIDAGAPYLDIGTGVDANLDPPATGARISFVVPGAPCLTCTEELDPLEVARWYKPAAQRLLDHAHGYGITEPSPSVVHLNGLAVNAAVAEIVAWITGARRPARRIDIGPTGSPDSLRLSDRQ